MRKLIIGKDRNGNQVTLPADLGDKKIAVLAQSKKGKTYGLGDILEELAAVQSPFIVTDPANNFWGLRVLPDGRPSKLEVVVVGGDHADLPFDKEKGERLAELLLATPVCAVIDIAFESAGAVRRFMGDFAGRLMQSKPDVPRVIVLEEAPVLIPQKTFGVQAQVCKAAVSRIATIGGNFGYGVILASQRAATIDKDVLSQCEALIVMGMTHKKDRDTVQEWMEAKDIDQRAYEAFKELGSLPPGDAWLWWPGEDRFDRFTFRKRETLHPREMQRLGLKQGQIKLGDMTTFVERARRELTKTIAQVPESPKKQPKKGMDEELYNRMINGSEKMAARIKELEEKNERLYQEKSKLERELSDADTRLATVRQLLRPQYDSLRTLFDNLGTQPNAVNIDRSRYERILTKAKSGVRTMVDYLLENNGEATRAQLATVAGVSSRSAYDYIYWMTRNGVVRAEGKTKVVLCQL